MDGGDIVGPRQHQEIAIALELARVIGEARAAEFRVGELEALDHRAHRAVEHENAFGEQAVEQVEVSLVVSRVVKRVGVSWMSSSQCFVRARRRWRPRRWR